MHLKMDSWHSEWVIEDNSRQQLFTSVDSTQFNSTYNSQDYTVDSPDFSRDDSVESGGEEIIDKSDTSVLKPTFKSVLQAKKRLQAFSTAKQLKRTGSKDEKTEDGDKSDKTSPKKLRKAVYPGDKAKAVIQEIEEIKKNEAQEARVEQLKHDALIATAMRSFKDLMRSRSRSLSPEREQHFKRREIKSRNYRRADSFNRRSPSPEEYSRRGDRRSPPRKPAYPKNWTEYKQLNLTVVKDEELKLKIFPKQKYSQHELVSRFINFTTPSPLIESFKSLSVEDKYENIPVSFMRVTKCRPPLTYSVNIKKNKESFITRNQLFQIISRDRRDSIEKLINTPSRYQPNNKILQSRQWYSKAWKKTSDAECKILENSVGLSFLQNYSDEEEENETEEIVICSSTKENDLKEITLPEETLPVKKIVEISEPQAKRDISIDANLALEQMFKQVKPRENIDDLRQEEKSEEFKRQQQNELKQTRKAIRELEEELERRKAIKTEEEAKERKKLRKRRKKKGKKKQESSSEEEEESPRKKKKKNKSKKKKHVEDESNSSEDEKKKKKHRRAGKYKKEKVKKKKEKSKKEETQMKEHKGTKKDDEPEEDPKDDNKKKKRKSNNDSISLDDKNELSTLEKPKKNKKSKKKKEKNVDRNDEKQSPKNNETSSKESKKNHHKANEEYMKESIENSGKKRRRKNRWGSIEPENIIEIADSYEIEKTDRGSSMKSKGYEKIDDKFELKQSTSKNDDKNGSINKEKLSKYEKELKTFNEEHNKSKEREKEARRTKENLENLFKFDESAKKKRESDEGKSKVFEYVKKSNEKIEDGSNKKHNEQEKHKMDLERNRKYSEKSEKIEKYDILGRSNKDRKSSEIIMKSEHQKERDHFKDSCQKEKSERHQKEKKHKEDSQKLDRIIIKQEPDWEILRNKRKRHRNTDSKEPSKVVENLDVLEDLEGFPLEKEVYNSKEKDMKEIPCKRSKDEYRRVETGTPDTDEYRENWEKDIFPIWESEDEAPPKPKGKLNNSWESDEEIFERHCVVETARSFKDTFDLEIPLNIKPFKRREVIDPDTELQLLKREGQSLNEERRRLEIEKLRVKELELKVIREVESKVKDQYKPKITREVENKLKEDQYNLKIMREVERKVKEDEYKSKVVREIENKWKEDQYKSKVTRDVENKLREGQYNPKIIGGIERKVKEDEYKPKVVSELESKEKEDQHKSKVTREVERNAKQDEYKSKIVRDVESKGKEDQYKLKDTREVEKKLKEDQYRQKIIREVERKVKEDEYKPKDLKEVESMVKEGQFKPKVVIEIESKVKEYQFKPKVVKEVESNVKEDSYKPKAIREVESTVKVDTSKSKVIREIKSSVKEDQHKPLKQIVTEDEKESRSIEQEKGEVKRGRWDKKVALPRISTPKVDIIDLDKIKTEIPDEDDSLTNVSSSTSLNNNSAVLENEYEEFMKAVSSSTSRKKGEERIKRSKVISSFESSSFESSDSESSSSKNLQTKIQSRSDGELGRKNFVFKNIITNLDELIPAPLDSHVNHNIVILPKDIPLIPMPLPKTEIKPVPVPSPTIDVEKIPKPLFNLGLSANITLDITSKLARSGVDSPSGKSLEFINPPPFVPSLTQSSKLQKLVEIPSKKPDCVVNFASPLTDVSLDSVLFEEKPADKDDTRLNEKPFVFTSMVLPSKKLLNNSNLNLGDSEDEEVNAAKSMRKLEEIIKENLTDSAKLSEDKEKVEVPVEKAKEIDTSKDVKKVANTETKDRSRSRSPPSNRNDSRRRSRERVVRRDVSPKRITNARMESPPRRRTREPSPKRRCSPRRHLSPRKRTPPRRRSSPVKRKYSPRRSVSPRFRRRSSISPPRKSSPRRSVSPKMRGSLPKKMKSKSPERLQSSYKTLENLLIDSNRRKSPITITSPLEGLKRSVADSTISDDLLPQPSVNVEEYTESPISRFYDRSVKPVDSPKRVPLDIRISQVLGLAKEEPKPITTTYSNYNYEQSQYRQQFSLTEQKCNVTPVQKTNVAVKQTKGSFVQVGNMVRIVPTEDIPVVDTAKIPIPPLPSVPPREKPIVNKKEKKSQIVQVGNMLQIVPADMLPDVPLPPEPKPPEPIPVEPKLEEKEPIPETSTIIQEKPSAETAMRLKVAERRAERDKRRQEREKRRKEKEKRRKEKEKQRQIKLKQRTENMIKKALQLEVESVGEEEVEETILNETPTQWPPLPVIVSSISKEVGKSILIRGGQSKSNVRSDKTKIVQFADGVRPGEGTSPSGGEELSSPPPASKKLPKEKRYKKTKLITKNPKKKVKVKVIKKRPETEESDEEDNLPPPSPPPGSPPPHLFPPRIKTHSINNVHPYIPNVVPIQASNNQQLYRPQLNIIMHPPHQPLHHGLPPPPHHHGPPPPPHLVPPPPPHHHGPPPPIHHGPPHHHHHGPPPPPGPHFHHGPPPPPGPPHHHGPPGFRWRHPASPPSPSGPHWHHHPHGPPPPYHF